MEKVMVLLLTAAVFAGGYYAVDCLGRFMEEYNNVICNDRERRITSSIFLPSGEDAPEAGTLLFCGESDPDAIIICVCKDASAIEWLLNGDKGSENG